MLLVDEDFRGLEDWGFNQGKVGVSDKSSEEPDEWLLELIVALGRDIVVLEVLLSVESDLLGLDLSVLNVNLVSNENDGDVLANSDEIFVPLGYVLIGNSRADVEHDNSAVSTDATIMVNT